MISCLTCKRWMLVRHEFNPPSKASVVTISKKLYPYCSVLVGPRNGFKCNLLWNWLRIYPNKFEVLFMNVSSSIEIKNCSK